MIGSMRNTLCVLLLAVPAAAGAESMDDVVRVGLIPGWRMESGAHMAALRVRLEPGWKTYWRAPGDAGIPPLFDWSGSENVSAVRVHWPVPHVFEQNGLRSVGYSGEVVMPVEITPARGDETIGLAGQIQIGVCQDICLPVSMAVSVSLPPDGGGHGAAAIRAALEDRPMTEAEAGVGAVTCRTEPIDDGLRLEVSIEMPRVASAEETVVEFADPTVWISEAATSRTDGRLTAVAELVPADAAPFALSRGDLRFTVLGDGRAVDIRGCTGAG
jgi:DsbC/DsbD-like thiol-disulfide interchange protein